MSKMDAPQENVDVSGVDWWGRAAVDMMMLAADTDEEATGIGSNWGIELSPIEVAPADASGRPATRLMVAETAATFIRLLLTLPIFL